MKIKKVGNSPELKANSEESVTEHEVKNSYVKNIDSKIYIFALVGILVITVTAGLTYYFLKPNKISEQLKSDSDINILELEKKEQELLKREENLANNLNDDPLTIVERKFRSFTSENTLSDSDLKNFYADKVHYYSWKNADKSKLLSDKKSFFKNWDRFVIKTSDVSFTQIKPNIVECNYDKEFDCENYSNGHKYSGKVRAIIVFEKLNKDWLITKETDEFIYYTDKNF